MEKDFELYIEKQNKLNTEYQRFVKKLVHSCCDISKDYNNLSFENKHRLQQELPLVLLTFRSELNNLTNN